MALKIKAAEAAGEVSYLNSPVPGSSDWMLTGYKNNISTQSVL